MVLLEGRSAAFCHSPCSQRVFFARQAVRSLVSPELQASVSCPYLGGWPGPGECESGDMGMSERIALQYVARKQREAEGAPGSGWEPGSWSCQFSFAPLRQSEKRAPNLVDCQSDFDGLGHVGAAGGGNDYRIGAGRSAVGIRLRSRGAATSAANDQS